jgi:hypothetical protein
MRRFVCTAFEKGGPFFMTTDKLKTLLPEVRVIGQRFIIHGTPGSMSDVQKVSMPVDIQSSRDAERSMEKTGVIPKHVWG